MRVLVSYSCASECLLKWALLSRRGFSDRFNVYHFVSRSVIEPDKPDLGWPTRLALLFSWWSASTLRSLPEQTRKSRLIIARDFLDHDFLLRTASLCLPVVNLMVIEKAHRLLQVRVLAVVELPDLLVGDLALRNQTEELLTRAYFMRSEQIAYTFE